MRDSVLFDVVLWMRAGEYATAMEGLMKDCPSHGELPLSRSAPSTDFAAALEVSIRPCAILHAQ